MTIPPAERRICVVLDVERFSKGTNLDQIAMERELRAITELVAGHAQLHWPEIEVEEKGDGLLLELPPGIDEPRVIPALVNGVCVALRESNRRAHSSRRLRLRMALTQGIRHPGDTGVVGKATIAACRLVDSAELRAALAGHPARALGVIVADDLYADVIAHGYPGLDPAQFTPVEVKIAGKVSTAGAEFVMKAWTHVPEPQPGRLLPAPRSRLRDSAAVGAIRRGAAPFGGAVLGVLAGEGLHQPQQHPHQVAGSGHGHLGAPDQPGAAHQPGHDTAHIPSAGSDATGDAGADGS